MEALTICVLGGTGFVGSCLCAELVKHGHRIRILSRRRERYRGLLVLPGVQIIECDVHDGIQLKTCFHNCDVVVNLVGILNEKGRHGKGFRVAHIELAQKIIATCNSCRIPRLLHMSALNASPDGKSFYLRTKGEAENYVHAAGNKIAVTSFRPSMIFGPQDNFLNRFASILRLTPGFFPLACADTKLAPVYVGDVVRVMADAIHDPDTYGSRINLCGPKQYTLKQLVSYTASVCSYKSKIVGLSDGLSRLQAHILGVVPGKPFSIDNYHSLQTDSICPETDHCPTPLEAIAPSYLLKQSRYARYDKFRTKHTD